jgi:hypothetical protein
MASDCSVIRPEFGDHQAVRHIFSIKRGKLYDITNRGLVKAVSLRRSGQKSSKRLWALQSIRDYLNSLLQAQNDSEHGSTD